MKCKQPRLGCERWPPCPFHSTITITPRASPDSPSFEIGKAIKRDPTVAQSFFYPLVIILWIQTSKFTPPLVDTYAFINPDKTVSTLRASIETHQKSPALIHSLNNIYKQKFQRFSFSPFITIPVPNYDVMTTL